MVCMSWAWEIYRFTYLLLRGSDPGCSLMACPDKHETNNVHERFGVTIPVAVNSRLRNRCPWGAGPDVGPVEISLACQPSTVKIHSSDSESWFLPHDCARYNGPSAPSLQRTTWLASTNLVWSSENKRLSCGSRPRDNSLTPPPPNAQVIRKYIPPL